MTNLAPMCCDEIISFFEKDFGHEEDWPFSRESIVDFFRSEQLVIASE